MKKSLLIVIALLAMASLMAAMALTRSLVSNKVEFAVVNTTEAKIGITPNDTDHPGVAKIVDNKMVLDFSPGMQPASKYFYKDLFFIKNNTDKTLYVGLRFNQCYPNSDSAEDMYLVGLHTVSTSRTLHNGENKQYNKALILGGSYFREGAYEGRMIELKSGEEIGVDFSFIIDGDTDLLKRESRNSISLQVHAKDDPKGDWSQ